MLKNNIMTPAQRVLKAIKQNDLPDEPGIWLTGPQILKILAAEQRAVVKLVKQQKSMRSCFEIESMTAAEAYDKACDDILAALRQRKG